jgi:hypothetical protein
VRCVSHIIAEEEGRSVLRPLNDTPYDGFRYIDEGRDLKINVVLTCGILRRLYVILFALYIFVRADMVVFVR